MKGPRPRDQIHNLLALRQHILLFLISNRLTGEEMVFLTSDYHCVIKSWSWGVVTSFVSCSTVGVSVWKMFFASNKVKANNPQ